jgi:hypothetical protein
MSGSISEADCARVLTGMSREDVRQLLGPPLTTVTFAGKGEEVWDWDLPALFGTCRFNVHFDLAGWVVRTSRSEESLG